jgi:hypothetical protein
VRVDQQDRPSDSPFLTVGEKALRRELVLNFEGMP